MSPDLAFEFSIYLVWTLESVSIAVLSVVTIPVPCVLACPILVQDRTQREKVLPFRLWTCTTEDLVRQ